MSSRDPLQPRRPHRQASNSEATPFDDSTVTPFPSPERKARTPKPKPANDGAPEFSEDAIALTFADRYADQLRYVTDWGRWLNWNGSVWKPDTINRVFTMARKVCRDAAAACDQPRVATAIASAKTVAAVERLARCDQRLATIGEQWDVKPFLLSVPEGVVDLRTGITGQPNRDDLLTQMAACAVAPPGTPHPLWTRFLDRITDHNAELTGFLQRYIGYCATGDISEHSFIFAYGTGANGKGTFINTISEMFGEHATVADMGTFIASTSDRHPTDVAKLRGSRLVVAQETQEGRRWNETKLKAMTGGDMMTARFMRQDFFDFKPTFKLFIIGNHRRNARRMDRGDPAAAAAGALQHSGARGGARQAFAREAQGRVARHHAVGCRWLLGMAAHRPVAAQHRARCHRGLLLQRGHLRAVARRCVRRRGRQRLQVGGRGRAVRRLDGLCEPGERGAGVDQGVLGADASARLCGLPEGQRQDPRSERRPAAARKCQ